LLSETTTRKDRQLKKRKTTAKHRKEALQRPRLQSAAMMIAVGAVSAICLSQATDASLTASSTAAVGASAGQWIVPSVSFSAQDYRTATVSWPSVSGYTSYVLQWAKTSDFASPNSATVNGTSYVINNLEASTNYYFRVQAVGAPASGGWSPTTPVTTIAMTPIDTKYNTVTALMGTPTSIEAAMGVGRNRNYTNGSIMWSSATGAFTSMNGPIRDKYLAWGGNTTAGFPTSDDNQTTPAGGGKFQTYNGLNAIVWSPATGAHVSHGGIRARWLAGGSDSGRMGFPTSDEIALATAGGYKQIYQNGAIYWSPATGGWEMGGAFYSTWLNNGAEAGYYGYPTSNERWIDATYVRQDFQNGHYLLWNNNTGMVTGY
jgi:uncharacterized protein with LGFP repeats